MKIKLGQIDAIKGSLRTFLSKELPVRTAYRFSKLTKQLEKELGELEENRRNLVKTHGDEIDGGRFQVTEDNKDVFAKQYQELLDYEIDVNFQPVSVNELGEIHMSSIDLANLTLVGLITDDDNDMQ